MTERLVNAAAPTLHVVLVGKEKPQSGAELAGGDGFNEGFNEGSGRSSRSDSPQTWPPDGRPPKRS